MSRKMPALLWSSVLIVLGVVPVAVVISTMAGLPSAICGSPAGRFLFLLFLLGLTLPFEGIITPLYYVAQALGILNTRWAIILPLIGLYHAIRRVLDASSLHQHADGDSRKQRGRRGEHLGSLLAHPCAARPAGPASPWQSCSRCGPGTSSCSHWCSWRTRPADHGRCAWCVPGALRHEHPAPVCRVAADPDADAGRVPDLPATVHLGPAAGFPEGMIQS